MSKFLTVFCGLLLFASPLYAQDNKVYIGENDTIRYSYTPLQTDSIPASFKGWKTLLKVGLLKETLTTTISSKLTVGKTNYLEKIMPATTGAVSITSRQPRTLPDIGVGLRRA